MDRAASNILAQLLAASCLLVAAWQLASRLRADFVPLEVQQPALTVSVSGAVNRPGHYELPWGAVVADLLELAGGLASGAAPELLAPARPLAQGDSIFVPLAVASDGSERISLNSSDSWTLQRLPGIGPALAGRIIAGRPYSAVEELLEVSGIGPATLARLVPLVTP